MEGGLATVYSFVNLAILRVGLAPVPGEAAATPKVGHCSTFKMAGSEDGGSVPEIRKHGVNADESIMAAVFEVEKEIPAKCDFCSSLHCLYACQVWR